MTNCPNCGAPIMNQQCEYCGTKFPKWTLMHTPDTKLSELLHGKSSTVDFLTVNEIRELVGLEPVNDMNYMSKVEFDRTSLRLSLLETVSIERRD